MYNVGWDHNISVCLCRQIFTYVCKVFTYVGVIFKVLYHERKRRIKRTIKVEIT